MFNWWIAFTTSSENVKSIEDVFPLAIRRLIKIYEFVFNKPWRDFKLWSEYMLSGIMQIIALIVFFISSLNFITSNIPEIIRTTIKTYKNSPFNQ